MAEQQERTPGIIDQAKAAYEQVVCAIIRPPRTTYDERHLGPRRFEFLGRTFIREDFEVHNVKDERLVCSRWAAEERPPMVPTLIFMHGNASARRSARGDPAARDGGLSRWAWPWCPLICGERFVRRRICDAGGQRTTSTVEP